MIIAVDCDDVLCELVTIWIERYNYEYTDTLKIEDITEWDITKFVHLSCKDKIYDYIRDEKIYDLLPQVKDALWGVNELRKMGHRIIVVSACDEGNMQAKYQWLKRNGFISDIREFVVCKDKSLIKCDILIDDKQDNIATTSAIGILFPRPWNKKFRLGEVEYGWNDIVSVIDNMDTNRICQQ